MSVSEHFLVAVKQNANNLFCQSAQTLDNRNTFQLQSAPAILDTLFNQPHWKCQKYSNLMKESVIVS